MFFVLICRNDCGGLRSYIRFCHVEQSRDISVLDPEIPRLRFASLGMTVIASARTVPRIYFSSARDRMKIGRVIGTADQRTRGDVEKTFPARDVAVITELLRPDVLDDRQVFRTRTQILPDGQHFASDFTQIVHRLKQFRLSLTEAEHHATLGYNIWR